MDNHDGMFDHPPSEMYVAKYTGHINTINCMLVIDDAKEAGEALKTTYIFTGGYDHLARCFNAETGECLATYRGHDSFIFSLKIGTTIERVQEGHEVVEASKWYLYTGSFDTTVRRWDVTTGDCVCVYALEYGDVVPRFKAGIVQLVEVHKELIFTVTPDSVLRAWNIQDGELNWESRHHKNAITGLQIREKYVVDDGQNLYVTHEELFTCATDRTVRVWVPATGECKRILRFDTQPLYCLYVRKDGALFVGAGSSIIYCESETGKTVRSYTSRYGAVKSLFADQTRVYAGTGFISQQFHIANGMKERMFAGHKSVLSAVQAHDKTLYTTGDDAVLTWDTEPLLFCCMDGDLKTLGVLLSGNQDMPAVDPEMNTGTGNSAMLLAGKGGQSEIIESLLMYSADVHRMSRAGETALHGASLAGAEKGVRVLLQAGANPNFSTPSQSFVLDNRGRMVEEDEQPKAYGYIDGDQSPLHYAARAGSGECCRLLIEREVPDRDCDNVDLHHCDARVALHSGADSNFKDSRWRTPVHIAALHGAAEALHVILIMRCKEGGDSDKTFAADYRLKDLQGKTPLKLASTWDCRRILWRTYMEAWAKENIMLKALGIPPVTIPPIEDSNTRRRRLVQVKDPLDMMM